MRQRAHGNRLHQSVRSGSHEANLSRNASLPVHSPFVLSLSKGLLKFVLALRHANFRSTSLFEKEGLREIFGRHCVKTAQNPPHPCRARIPLHRNAVQQARPAGRETPASPSFKKEEVLRISLAVILRYEFQQTPKGWKHQALWQAQNLPRHA